MNVVVKIAVAGGHALDQVVNRSLARGVAKRDTARPLGETLAVAHGVIAVSGAGA